MTLALPLSTVPIARGQTLLIDNSAAKEKIVTASGTLDINNLTYVRDPYVLPLDIASGTTSFSKKLLLSWFINNDTAQSPVVPRHRRRTSTDGGVTYGVIQGTPSTTVPGVDTDNVYFCNAVRRKNGTLLAVEFKPDYPANLPQAQFPFDYYTSINNGDTWIRHTDGIVNFTPGTGYGIRFHRGIFEDEDGTLYASAYLTFSNGAVPPAPIPTSPHQLKSTNGGTTWYPVLNTSGNPVAIAPGFDESNVVRCADGSWLVVMRSKTAGQPLKYARSTNKGVSWTAPAFLPGLGGTVSIDPPAPPAGQAPTIIDDGNESIDPNLVLMTNGVLVLSYGRPNQKLAFSQDGSGLLWSNVTTTYVDAPPDFTKVTSANSHTAAIGPSTLLAYGDYYAITTSTNTQGIWQKKIEIKRSNLINKIDLKTMYIVDPTFVTTDMNHVDTAHPEARKFGAVDGSNHYWSGAFKVGTSASYTIDLRRPFDVNAIGVCLHHDVPQSATVEIALNAGGPWATVKTYTNKRHYALDYTPIIATPAQFVRVTTSGGTGTLVGLNELEVYSTSDSFENDKQLNQDPSGYPAPPNNGFWVTAAGTFPTGYKSERALNMTDSDGTLKYITKTIASGSTKTLEFMLKPLTIPAGGSIQWYLMSGTTHAFRMKVTNTGAIQWWNGSVYTTVTGATAPLNTWTRIKLVGTVNVSGSLDKATLYINGTQVGATNSIGSENDVTSLDGLKLASGGAAATGDQALFDDVMIK